MVVGIILGAGEGKRIGTSKLTLPLGSKRVIEWVLEAATLSLLNKIIFVIRPGEKELLEIGKKWKAIVVMNTEYQEGLSRSIQKALIELDSWHENIDGFCLILGDQPFISSKIINQLIDAFNCGKKEIVVPYYQGRRGNPVLFDIAWKPYLMKVTGDVGGRVLIRRYPEKVKRVDFRNHAILFDIDRKEDYLKAKNVFEGKGRESETNSLY